MLTIYLGFEAGGFFPGSTSVAAIGVAVVLMLRLVLARQPFGGLSWRSGVAIAALVLYAAWTLTSTAWSHAPGRAVIEANRTLLYLLILVLFASLPRTRGRLTALAEGFGLGSVVLCATALATRTLPAVFPIAPEIANERLAYPLTYWNALGLLASLGVLVCLGLSACERLPRALRAASAAAVPLLGATLLLTFSRAGIVAGLVGLVGLVLACHSRALIFTLLATGPATGLALGAAYSATALATRDPTGPSAVSEGLHVGLVVAGAGAAALLLRFVLARWDQPPDRRRRLGAHARRAIGVLALLALVGGGVGGGALGLRALSDQYRRFTLGDQLPGGQEVRTRLLNPANNGRLAEWRVAVDAWESQPIRGTGAGTYQTEWYRNRDAAHDVVNAHSLYLETLSDLGLVGLLFLGVSLLAVLAGIASRVPGSHRAIAGSILAATLCWLFHAGADWDWQMPAVTWWLFAAGGIALARDGRRVPTGRMAGRLVRPFLAVLVAVLALLPIQVGLSQLDLTRAVQAFERGDCGAAVTYSLASTSDLAARPEPYELRGYCYAGSGQGTLATATIENAIRRDPQNWEFYYDMAVVRGLSGLDPRAATRQAVTLNPLSPFTTSLAQAVRTADPRVWRRSAAKAVLLVP